MNKFKDSDMSREARESRYNEYVGLRSLPFFGSRSQSKRFTRLETLRIRDNRYAFDQDEAGR